MNQNMKTVGTYYWACKCGDFDSHKYEVWTKHKFYKPEFMLEDVQFEPAVCNECGNNMYLDKLHVEFFDYHDKKIDGSDWFWPVSKEETI